VTELAVTPVVRVRAAVLDPFGSVVAEGELCVPHVPGIDESTPSVADEVRARLTGRRMMLDMPGYDGPAYSLRITEA
jgi:hypothetical protein